MAGKTMKQQKQDKSSSPFKWFLSVEVLLFGVAILVAIVAYNIFFK